MRKFLLYISFAWNTIIASFKKIKLESLKKKGKLEEAEIYRDKCVEKWANAILKSARLDVEVIGQENLKDDEHYLFVGNHQSYFDILVTLAKLDRSVGFVAKEELVKAPVIRYWMKELKCVFINRSNAREGLKSILEAANNIKEGRDMVIFPEGTRSKSHSVSEFKKGSLKLGFKAKAKVVPITFLNLYKGYEKSESGLKKIKAKMIIGNPIDTSKMSREEQEVLHSKIREQIIENINKYEEVK